MNEHVALWGWDTAAWQKVRTDAAGHLQVDVLSGAAVETRLHGYDGANWQTLLVEAAALKNLRVRLYAGAEAIHTETNHPNNTTMGGEKVLTVIAVPHLRRSADNAYAAFSAEKLTDNNAGLQIPTAAIVAFDGSNYDRLRCYNTGILKVGRAEVGLLDVRATATGQVGAAGARKLYWMNVTPSAGNSLVELTDATAGGAGIKYECFHTSKESHIHNLDPPLEFSNGIYLETFTNMTSVIFGYL
ncbi:hypothetical protein LCGC14_0915720 [marine sediment metagenome]|uniref:Uncharacterized protein n=1 Tax=marine sediment metagenome TaxID=412755 RepID=A0A0F9NSB3_9ZZZZ